jgi:tRNA nucleotidyltransferase (CCA-adding enzyme)
MVINIPQQVNRAIDILEKNGHSAYVVGGAVRDAIMKKPAHDWDITTSALPEETMDAFEGFRIIETGLKHGTVTVIVDGTDLEITTYRIEHGYSDNRHPDKVDFTDRVEDDLSRRDFTVNAIAYSPVRGFADPFGGRDDIEKNVIRCVGEADKRFGEDALRILRALRFSSVLGFEIDPDTAESIHRNYPLLKNISVERIFVEMSKLLCGKDAGRILREFEDVVFYILPELVPMKNCVQNHERHIFDVWGHTVKAVESVPPIAELRFAMLFHDSGKPHCKTTDEKGIDHFYSHGKISRKIADKTFI